MMRDAAASTGRILLFFALVVLMAAAGAVALLMLGMPLDGNPMQGRMGFAFAAISFLSMTLPAAFLAYVFHRKSPMAMGLGPGSATADFLSGSVVGGFIFVMALVGAFAGGWARFDPNFAGFSMEAFGLSAAILTLHSAGEEVALRGYVLQELMTKFSTATSVVVSSLIFAALHAPELIESGMWVVGAANIFFAGVLMSLAYLKTRSLWLPIGIHAGWNVAQGPLLGLKVSGIDLELGWQPVALQGPDMMTGGSFGFEGSVLAMAGPVLGILMMLLFGRKRA